MRLQSAHGPAGQSALLAQARPAIKAFRSEYAAPAQGHAARSAMVSGEVPHVRWPGSITVPGPVRHVIPVCGVLPRPAAPPHLNGQNVVHLINLARPEDAC